MIQPADRMSCRAGEDRPVCDSDPQKVVHLSRDEAARDNASRAIVDFNAGMNPRDERVSAHVKL